MRSLPRSGLWRLVGQPGVAGAIGAAVRRFEPAIGEVPAHWIAERPSAGERADFLEPDPRHLPDLRLGKRPCRLLSGFNSEITRAGGGGALLAGVGPGARTSRRLRLIHLGRRRAGREGAPASAELDPDPIGLADHGVAGRRAERLSDDARASSFVRQPLESLDRLVCPQHLRAPMIPRRGAPPLNGTVFCTLAATRTRRLPRPGCL